MVRRRWWAWWLLSLVLAAAGGVALVWKLNTPPQRIVAFEGPHQAGIETAQPKFGLVAAFDVTTLEAGELKALFQAWTAAARLLTAGEPLPGDPETDEPGDSGETRGYLAARLTLTFGVGPSLFDDRFGLADQRPEALAALPEFLNDDLNPEWSDGDLVVQICSDDTVTMYHALRNLTRLARGVASARWVQAGFQPSADVNPRPPARNLQGFHDGTSNPDPEKPATFDPVVWAEGPRWMTGGSYLVVRRIKILVENWDRIGTLDQERVIGREKVSGHPLALQGENSHVRVVKEGGEVIFRRPFSYFNGLDPETLRWDSGLLFLAWQKDPRTQFVPMQKRLSEYDSLNEYTQAVGSAVFAVFPGVGHGEYVGQTLFH